MRKLSSAIAAMLLATSVFAEEGPTLLQRTHMHLASLIRNADHVGGADARALALSLIQRLPDEESSEKEQQEFFGEFNEMRAAIFPEENADTIASFREDAAILLADMDDALSILVKGNEFGGLRAEIAGLQSRLQLVSDAAQLSGWIARFDTVAAGLLKHAVPSDPTILREDIRALLTNLSTYTRQLKQAEILTGNTLSRAGALLSELETVETEEDIDAFLPKLEELLTTAL